MTPTRENYLALGLGLTPEEVQTLNTLAFEASQQAQLDEGFQNFYPVSWEEQFENFLEKCQNLAQKELVLISKDRRQDYLVEGEQFHCLLTPKGELYVRLLNSQE